MLTKKANKKAEILNKAKSKRERERTECYRIRKNQKEKKDREVRAKREGEIHRKCD